jgi:hypothetical protein
MLNLWAFIYAYWGTRFRFIKGGFGFGRCVTLMECVTGCIAGNCFHCKISSHVHSYRSPHATTTANAAATHTHCSDGLLILAEFLKIFV